MSQDNVLLAQAAIRTEVERLNKKLRDAGLKVAHVTFVVSGPISKGWSVDNDYAYPDPRRVYQSCGTVAEAEAVVDDLICNRPMSAEELAATLGIARAA